MNVEMTYEPGRTGIVKDSPASGSPPAVRVRVLPALVVRMTEPVTRPVSVPEMGTATSAFSAVSAGPSVTTSLAASPLSMTTDVSASAPTSPTAAESVPASAAP